MLPNLADRASKVIGKQVPGSNEPVQRAHVDYTLYSGPNRLKQLMPEEAEKLQQSPYAVIQVITALPLQFCSISPVFLVNYNLAGACDIPYSQLPACLKTSANESLA